MLQQKARPVALAQEGHPYSSALYARTLAHVGDMLPVPAWGTSVLLRPIPATASQMDAMGPYPVCVLASEADIDAGLQTLRAAGAVSVVLVADPLCGPEMRVLQSHFPLCRPFKTHYVIDRSIGPAVLSKHHQERVRRGRRRATARLVSLRDPAWQAHWTRLYAGLVRHRGITGLQAFPAAYFDALAQLPERQVLAFAVEDPQGDVLAMQLWVRHGEHAYSHLTATSAAGYQASATYVVYAAAIEYLGDCRVLDLGGGAGFTDDPDDSLASFKRGFANASVMSVLCGAVLDPTAYERLAGPRTGAYFPVYRAPG